MPDDELPTTGDSETDEQEKAGDTEEYTGVPVTEEELGAVWESGDAPG